MLRIFKKIFKDPILFVTILAMVASTLTTFFLVNKNYQEINFLESKIQNKKIKIQNLSNNINQRYAQLSTLVLLESGPLKKDQRTEIIKNKFLDIVPDLDDEYSIIDALNEFEEDRINKINLINDLYIEQISLDIDVNDLVRNINIYTALAAFFQITGLVMIIIRKDFGADDIY